MARVATSTSSHRKLIMVELFTHLTEPLVPMPVVKFTSPLMAKYLSASEHKMMFPL